MVTFKDYCINEAIHEVVNIYINDKIANKNVEISKDGRKWVVVDNDKELRISRSLSKSSEIYEFFAVLFSTIAFAFNCIRPDFYEYYSQAIQILNDLENPPKVTSVFKKGRVSKAVSENVMQIDSGREVKSALPSHLRAISRDERQEYVDNQIDALTEEYPPVDYQGTFQDENGVIFVCDGEAWKLSDVLILKPAFFQNKAKKEVEEYIESRTDEYDEKYPPIYFEGQSIIDENGIQFYCEDETWNFKE